MKVLVVSDTHGSVKAWRDIQKLFNLSEMDAIFHLGDVLYHGPRNPLPELYNPAQLLEELKMSKVKFIRGNCDADVDVKQLDAPEIPRISVECFGEFCLMLTHGEIFEENDLSDFLRDKSVHFLLHGHTHVSKIEEVEGKVVLNPGSPSLPKGGTPRSVLLLEIDGREISANFVDLESGNVYMRGRWTLKGSSLTRLE